MLPDDLAVAFSHSDINPSAIMVSEESLCSILALVDWQQSGQYPDYSELCKAEFTAVVNSEWGKDMSYCSYKRPRSHAWKDLSLILAPLVTS